MSTKEQSSASLKFEEFKKLVLDDYALACLSREVSLIGRKEVLTGKAKFGIFGDGKEVAQIAMARTFTEGDFRTGYYRDQTFMFASGMLTPKEFFAQLYANTDLEKEPSSGGRQMNAHFATRSLNEDGSWKDLTKMKNSAADSSPTSSQMPRAVGLGLASKLYRSNKEIAEGTNFSNKGNEVVFATIGDASTSEGLFWESLNASCVLEIPIAFNVWDDGYGISVPIDYQTTKGSISDAIAGFARDEKGGIRIYKAKAWDYAQLCETYEKGIAEVRETHIPAFFHIQECTQPQGHSTSGSHERYKSPERLQWEKDFDCITKMREWLIANALGTVESLKEIEEKSKEEARTARKEAWNEYQEPIKKSIDKVSHWLANVAQESTQKDQILRIIKQLTSSTDPFKRDIMEAVHQVLRITKGEDIDARLSLIEWKEQFNFEQSQNYCSHLYSVSDERALNVEEIAPIYHEDSKMVNGFEILNQCFEANFRKNPKIYAFGEDLGKIGDVNQGFAGLQEKFGEERIFDVGIREATIIGQGMGMAMRGLRPIAEIQYLDYLLFGLQPLSDDLATLHYRTRGGQKAPLIVRTRGHRLEGIWHTGSPMGMVLNALRGMYVCVPRNMTQAAGFYNTLLASDDAGLIIECLNGYRKKEQLPTNVGEFTISLGKTELLHSGEDVTLVSYGSCIPVAQEAVKMLAEEGISVELIDVQTLIPFDLSHDISKSLKRTNRIVFLDEDVPGGATAFMMQKVMEEQMCYLYLDSAPVTITANEHRSPYGSDGDYFSKPHKQQVFEAVYEMMHEVEPDRFPMFY